MIRLIPHTLPIKNTIWFMPKGLSHVYNSLFSLSSSFHQGSFILTFFFLLIGINAFAQVPVFQSSSTNVGSGNTATVNIAAGVIGGDLMVIGLMYEKGSTVA